LAEGRVVLGDLVVATAEVSEGIIITIGDIGRYADQVGIGARCCNTCQIESTGEAVIIYKVIHLAFRQLGVVIVLATPDVESAVVLGDLSIGTK
tara:strand:+ start:552 stop:833 length:282 start_codon:yes stop_codon:yes gene_type:complete